jgi:hypothetical protein
MPKIEEIREYVRRHADRVRSETFESNELMSSADQLTLIAETLFKIFDYKGEPLRSWVENELRNLHIPKGG